MAGTRDARERVTQGSRICGSGGSSIVGSGGSVGTGTPSPGMVGQLSEALAVPLRERRRLFTAAGYVPDASELPLGSPGLAQVNEALEQIAYADRLILNKIDLVCTFYAITCPLGRHPAACGPPPTFYVFPAPTFRYEDLLSCQARDTAAHCDAIVKCGVLALQTVCSYSAHSTWRFELNVEVRLCFVCDMGMQFVSAVHVLLCLSASDAAHRIN